MMLTAGRWPLFGVPCGGRRNDFGHGFAQLDDKFTLMFFFVLFRRYKNISW